MTTAHSFPSALHLWVRRLYRFSLLPLCLLAGASAAHAATIDVPADQPTIQAAVNAASNGDTVLIADGTYTGPGNVDINFNGKNITVTSQHGAASTIIDCQGSSSASHRGFTLRSGEIGAVISGLTIKNGYEGSDSGGAIFLLQGTATVSNCILTGNHASGDGGGIYDDSERVSITNCVFSGNSVNNSGGGICIFNAAATLTNCTLTGNTSTDGCDVYYDDDPSNPVSLTNCVLYGEPSGGSAISSYSLTATQCDIQGGHGGTGNINADPKFVSSADFHLQPSSPCLGAGTSAGAPAATIDGLTRPNPPSIGAYEEVVATATTLTSSLNPSDAGQSVTLTAQVAASTGTAVPAGSVQFVVDGANSGSPVSLGNTGAATYDATGFSANSHTVTAVYMPASGFSASTSNTLTQTVNSVFVPSYDALWVASDGEFSVWEAALGGSFAAHDFDAVSGFTASAFAITPDTHAHVLLTAANGAISLADIPVSTLLRDHNSISQATSYGPFSGWTAQALAAGPDSAIRVLWTNGSGQMSLWKVHTDGTYDHAEYGPYSGWTAHFLSAAPDSTLRVLWTSTSGEASFWVMDSTGGYQNFEYGPYAGWTPSALATGPDGLSHLTWNHAGDGLVSLWSLSDSGMFTFANFGPYTDWAAGALTVSADDTLHVGWSEPGGTASLWDVSAANPLSFTDALYGPYGSWQLQSLSATP